MVSAGRKTSFWKEDEGVSMVEGLLVFPLVLLMFAAFFEFSFAVHQWNQTVKALQLGARSAAVSDTLLSDVAAFAADFTDLDVADAVPATVVAVGCGGDYADSCVSGPLNRLVYGSDNKCDSNTGTSLPGMCDFNSRIKPEHIEITYYRAGLGYVGRIDGAVLTISLALDDLKFHLPLVGALLGLDDISVPAHPVTVTSEDMASCLTDDCT